MTHISNGIHSEKVFILFNFTNRLPIAEDFGDWFAENCSPLKTK